MVDDASVEMLRSIIGEGVDDASLRTLLLRAGGDVSGAANSFFDGGLPVMHEDNGADFRPTPVSSVGDDVLGTLFKTLEDQGRKLAGARARRLPERLGRCAPLHTHASSRPPTHPRNPR